MSAIALSRRLYRALNVLHLKWALRCVNRRLAHIEIDWRASSDIAYAMRCVEAQPAWLTAQRNVMRMQYRHLAAQRQQICSELAAMGVAP
jgi:hypothetical protein